MSKSKESMKLQALAKILAMFPDKVAPYVNQAIKQLPLDTQEEIAAQMDVLQKIVGGSVPAYDYMLKTVQRLAQPAVRPISNIAIVGAINVGKSTLFNALLAGTSKPADVSPVPGTTTVNQEGHVSLFNIIDTPGFAHGAETGVAESNQALCACEESDFLIVVFDASRGITNDDRRVFEHVVSLHKPFVVALNKQDLISPKAVKQVQESCARDLGINPLAVNAVSAAKGKGIQNLLLAAAAHEPRLLAELGRSVPALRSRLAWQAIRRSSLAAACATLVPIPLIDFIPLTAIQCSMVVTIARIYGKPMTKARAFELLTSLGVGLGARTLFQQLSKLAGPPGWVLSIAIATAATLTIGATCVKWFSTGIKPTKESVGQMGSYLQKKLLSLHCLHRPNKPKKGDIRKDLTHSLEHLTQELEDAVGIPAPAEPAAPSEPDLTKKNTQERKKP